MPGEHQHEDDKLKNQVCTCSALAGKEAEKAAQTKDRIGDVAGLQAVAQLHDNVGYVAPLC